MGEDVGTEKGMSWGKFGGATATGLTGAGILIGLAGVGVGVIASSGLSTAAITNAATGKLTSSTIRETIKLGKGRIQVNTYTAGKATSWMSKLGKSLTTNPAVGLALVGGLMGAAYGTVSMKSWEIWGRAEARDSLSMAFTKAKGNPKLRAEIKKAVAELTSDDTWTIITHWIPGLNVIIASEWKFMAAELLEEAIEWDEAAKETEVPTQEQIKQTFIEGQRAELNIHPGFTPEGTAFEKLEAGLSIGGLGGATKIITSVGKAALKGIPQGAKEITEKFIRENYDEFLDFFIKKAGSTKKITEKFIRENYDEALEFLIKK